MQKNAVIWLRNYLGMLGSNGAAYKSSWRAPSPGKFRLLLSSDFPMNFPGEPFEGQHRWFKSPNTSTQTSPGGQMLLVTPNPSTSVGAGLLEKVEVWPCKLVCSKAAVGEHTHTGGKG